MSVTNVVVVVVVVAVIVIAVDGKLCFWWLISHTLLYLPNVIVVIVIVAVLWRFKCDGRCALCGKIRSGPELSKMTLSRQSWLLRVVSLNWPKQRKDKKKTSTRWKLVLPQPWREQLVKFSGAHLYLTDICALHERPRLYTLRLGLHANPFRWSCCCHCCCWPSQLPSPENIKILARIRICEL